MMITKVCPKLYSFLANDKFDIAKVQEDIKSEIPEAFTFTKDVIEKQFGTKVSNLREYFDLSDDLISVFGGPPNTRPQHPRAATYALSSAYNSSHTNTYTKKELQRVQTYILVRNFEHYDLNSDHVYENIYRSRLLTPLIEMLENAKTLIL